MAGTRRAPESAPTRLLSDSREATSIAWDPIIESDANRIQRFNIQAAKRITRHPSLRPIGSMDAILPLEGSSNDAAVTFGSESSHEETFACFCIEGHMRYVPLNDIQRYPKSLLADMCRECSDCLRGIPVHVNKDVSLFDWIIEVYRGRHHECPLPSVPMTELERELDFFRLPSFEELELYVRADWHRKRRLDSIQQLKTQILKLLSNNSPLKSSFEFLLFWNQDKIWTDCVNVELLWNHTEPQYYNEESAILNILFKSGFVRPWTCTKIFMSREHLFMENKPKNWSMGFPILTPVTLKQFNTEFDRYGFAMSQEFSHVCIGSDSFTKVVCIPYIRISY